MKAGLYIAVLFQCFACMASGEENAVTVYLNFIRQLNNPSVYLKTMSYQIDDQGETATKLLVETWRSPNKHHVVSTYFEQFVDTAFQVTIVPTEKKIIVTKVSLLEQESLDSQKAYFESLTYASILQEANITLRGANLEISYKPEFQERYGIGKLLIYIKENQVVSLEIHRKINGMSIIEVSEYLAVNAHCTDIPFEGSALSQAISNKKLKEKYQAYQLVNLSGEAIN